MPSRTLENTTVRAIYKITLVLRFNFTFAEREAVRPAEREALYYLHRVLVVGNTSLSERGREAPKSLGVLGVIEASANIGYSGSVCSCRRPSFCASFFSCVLGCARRLPPSFIVQGGEDYMCPISTRLPFSLPPHGLGENSWLSLSPSAVEHGVRRGHRPCESFRPCPERILIMWRQSTAW